MKNKILTALSSLALVVFLSATSAAADMTYPPDYPEETDLTTDISYEAGRGSPFMSERLIVGAGDADIIRPDETIISEYEGVFLLQYDTPEETEEAFGYYQEVADFVSADSDAEAAEEVISDSSNESYSDESYSDSSDMDVSSGNADSDTSSENTYADIPDSETEKGSEETDALTELEQAVESAPPVEEESADQENISASYNIIAVVDTGMPEGNSHVIEYISMLGDDGYDDNGHGTDTLNSILSQNEDAQVISIKSLGSNGHGDVSSVYAGIEYAIERQADIILLPLYAYNTEKSSAIGQAVRDAVNAGIMVAGAAGNDGKNVKYYVPGSIGEAYVIGACDENGNRIDSSNYGDTVDYYVEAESTSEASAKFAGYLSTLNSDNMDDSLAAKAEEGGFLWTADEVQKDNESSYMEADENVSNPVSSLEDFRVAGDKTLILKMSLGGKVKITDADGHWKKIWRWTDGSIIGTQDQLNGTGKNADYAFTATTDEYGRILLNYTQGSSITIELISDSGDAKELISVDADGNYEKTNISTPYTVTMSDDVYLYSKFGDSITLDSTTQRPDAKNYEANGITDPEPASSTRHGEKIFGEDPFDEEYSAGYLCIHSIDNVGSGVTLDKSASTSGYGFMAVGYNRTRQDNCYVDHYNGACINGTFYDVREYIWCYGDEGWDDSGKFGWAIKAKQGGAKLYARDPGFNYMNGSIVPKDEAGKEKICREFHFYPAGTLATTSSPTTSQEVTFKGVVCGSDLDSPIVSGKRSPDTSEGYTFLSPCAGVWLSRYTHVTEHGDNTWVGTWSCGSEQIHHSDAEFPERETLWAEVSGTPSEPMTIAYHASYWLSSSLNYYGTNVNYVLVRDAKPSGFTPTDEKHVVWELPTGAKGPVASRAAMYSNYTVADAYDYGHYYFVGWYENVNLTSPMNAGTTILLKGGDKTLFGTYYTHKYQVTTEVTNGTITASTKPKSIREGLDKQVSYSPNEGYELESITYDDNEGEKHTLTSDDLKKHGGSLKNTYVKVTTDNITFLNISADHNVKVIYRPVYKITTSCEPAEGGTIDPDITGISKGATKTISYTPNEGWYIDKIQIDGEDVTSKFKSETGAVSEERGYTCNSEKTIFSNISADHSVYVHFKSDPKMTLTKTVTYPESTKSIDGQVVLQGTQLKYTLNYFNNSESTENITITDEIPEHTAYVKGSASDASYSDGKLTWKLGEIKKNQGGSVSFLVKVDPEATSETITNTATGTATITSTSKSSDVTSNTVTNYTIVPVKSVVNVSEKDINGKSIAAGQKITYKVSVTNTTNVTKAFTITDTLPSGMTCDDSDGSFADGVVTWKKTLSPKQKLTGEISVHPTRAGQFDNYFNLAVDNATIRSNTVTNYVYVINLMKTASNNTNKALQGAVFVLKNSSNKYYKFSNNLVSWVNDEDSATQYTTDEEGKISFFGMEPGTYTLIEVEAPNGYTLSDSETTVTVSKNSYEQTISVTNHPLAQLPSAGGRGIVLVIAIAVVLALAGIIIARKNPNIYGGK